MDDFLWPREDIIEVSADGFLLIKKSSGAARLLLDEDEKQPILLHTTTALLRSLYPSLGAREIFLRSGYQHEHEVEGTTLTRDEECQCLGDDTLQKTESGTFFADADADGAETESTPLVPIPIHDKQIENANEKSKDGETVIATALEAKQKQQLSSMIPAEYQSYQKLKRIENLPNEINLALQDIRTFRHRIVGGGSRSAADDPYGGSVKVRALEHQQQRLLQRHSRIPGGSVSGSKEDADTTIHKASLSSSNALDDDDAKKPGSDGTESIIAIKMARTINSIRALFPHLLPILYHSRRNDKNLVIGKIRYKTRRNGPMCWLLGTEAFGSSSCKQNLAAREDVKRILEAFVGFETASRISKDSKGAPSFWPSLWIKHLAKRSNPDLLSPILVLAIKSGTSEKDIESIARDCDVTINARDQATGAQGVDQQYQKAVRKIHHRLSNVLTSRFPGARLSIYGSCLSNLSIGKGSDVDMSLSIPAADSLKKGFHDGSIGARHYEQSIKNLVYKVFRKLSSLKAEFRGMTPITKARIPVITGTYIYASNPFTEDGSINFDICFLNDIAVANSGLLREYSLVDPRVRRLMIAVKQWAKEHKINSAKEKCLSSYTWMNLVVFYLQCIGFLPNLQSPVLMNAAGLVPDPERNYWHFINNLDTCTLNWETIRRSKLWALPREFEESPLSLLLYGFFEFYSSRFPFGTHAVSIRRADISLSKLATRKANLFFSIEDPFETYDSHCPHDLGTPLNDYGSKKIMNCLRDAEDHLRKMLCSEKLHQGKLWPSPPFVEPEPTRRNAKKSGFKRFDPLCQQYSNNDDKPLSGQSRRHTSETRVEAGGPQNTKRNRKANRRKPN